MNGDLLNGDLLLGQTSSGRVVLRGDRIIAHVAVLCRADGHDGERADLLPSVVLDTALRSCLAKLFAYSTVSFEEHRRRGVGVPSAALSEFWTVAAAISQSPFTCAACAAKVAT